MNALPPNPILLVDDEEQALASYDLNLRYCGLSNTIRCSDPRQVMGILDAKDVSLVMLDLNMPHIRGETLLAQIRKRSPKLPVIVITGQNDVDTAVGCMKAGSADYLVKPVDRSHLLSAVRRALESGGKSPPPSPPGLGPAPSEADPFAAIVSANARMNALKRYLAAVAGSGEPVLICGETGVGKELFARAIHAASGRGGKIIAVNVAGLDDAMFADTLFGHRKGAFTGATTSRAGMIEEAGGGSLLLDEIGDLSVVSQLKLLRLIQEKEYYPLGSDVPAAMRARLIVATNRPLDELMLAGRFREDLYFRLRTHLVAIPPLRERMDDLPPLTSHFLAKAAQRLGRPVPKASPGICALLLRHGFPGNVRELEAMLFNAVALAQDDTLPEAPLAAWIGSQSGGAENGLGLFPPVLGAAPTSAKTLRQAGEQAIAEALRLSGGNQAKAARMLGITRQALNRRILTEKRGQRTRNTDVDG